MQLPNGGNSLLGSEFNLGKVKLPTEPCHVRGGIRGGGMVAFLQVI